MPRTFCYLSTNNLLLSFASRRLSLSPSAQYVAEHLQRHIAAAGLLFSLSYCLHPRLLWIQPESTLSKSLPLTKPQHRSEELNMVSNIARHLALG